jgi:ADP-ribosylation factor related protein 1
LVRSFFTPRARPVSCSPLFPNAEIPTRTLDAVLSAPQILGVPLLLLANKQDNPNSLSVAEIRHDYEEWYQHKIECARRKQGNEMENQQRRERIASLDVMGLSALEG